MLTTQCKMEVRILSGGVTKNLTLHGMSKIDFQPDFRNALMLSFLMMYNTMGSKVDGLAVREHFLSKSAWKSPILAARFSDHLTLEGASTHNFKDYDLFRRCFWQLFDFLNRTNGSSESSCPKFSETHAEKVSIFKIVGASPLQSQVIQKSCRQNRWFLGIFWEIMLSHGQTVDFRQ